MKPRKFMLAAVATLALAIIAPLTARAEISPVYQNPSGRPVTYGCKGPRSPIGPYNGFSCPGDQSCTGDDARNAGECRTECLRYGSSGVLQVSGTADCRAQGGTFIPIEGAQ